MLWPPKVCPIPRTGRRRPRASEQSSTPYLLRRRARWTPGSGDGCERQLRALHVVICQGDELLTRRTEPAAFTRRQRRLRRQAEWVPYRP